MLYNESFAFLFVFWFGLFFFFLVQDIFLGCFLIHLSYLQVCHGKVPVGKVKPFGVRQVWK